jgi:hypothetical protein
VASRAGGGEYRNAAFEITTEWLEPDETLSIHLRADWNSIRQERQVRDDVSHVSPGGDKRFTVHASLEAVVYSVLDEIDFSASRSILRESRVAPDPGHGILPKTIVEMTAGASERIADIAREAVPRREKNRTPAHGRDTIGAVVELSVGRDSKCHAPGSRGLLRGNSRLWTRALGWNEQDQARNNTSGD